MLVMTTDRIVAKLDEMQKEIGRLSQAVERLQFGEEEAAPRRPGRPDRPGYNRCRSVLYLLKDLNPTLPQADRWALTQSLLNRSLGIDRSASQRFIKDYQEEIDQLHRDSNIDPSNAYQNRGNDIDTLIAALPEYEIVTLELPLIQVEALLDAAETVLGELEKKKETHSLRSRLEAAIDLLVDVVDPQEEESSG